MNNICFIGGFFPDRIRDEIKNNSVFNIQNAADTLQHSLLQGLFFHYPEMRVINAPFVGSYPYRYKKIYIPSCNIDKNSSSIGFINITGIKYFFIKKKLYKHLYEWASNNFENKTIIIYSAQLYLLEVVLEIRKHFQDIKICLIVPDLVQHMNSPQGIIYRIFQKYLINKMENLLPKIDSYVLLSKAMTQKLPVKNNNWTIIEGIFYNQTYEFTKNTNLNVKKILYSGSLNRKYGILNLLEAFSSIKEANLELIICGDGDVKNEIIQASKKDSRIIYLGVIPRGNVLQLQSESTLLVNPRTPEGEYTKYSFPSKIMEYLASGTATLIYKLPGIPEEYYDYCYTIENDFSIDRLANEIKTICSSDPIDLKTIGVNAKEFILKEKNPISQCTKIKDLIENQQQNKQ